MIFSILVFLFILTSIVFIHELGHFLSAKKFKVKVEEFGLGLPPRAIGKIIGETIYSINWLPIGGFVRLKGEDTSDYNPKDNHNLINKKPYQKFIIIGGGVFMNFMLTIVIFYFVLASKGFRTDPIILVSDYKFALGEEVNLPNIITFIQKDSEAERAGMQFGDRIYKLSDGDLALEPNTIEEAKSFYKGKEGKEIELFTENIITKQQNIYKIKPKFIESIKQAGIGAGLNNAVVISYEKPIDKILAGIYHSINLTLYSFDMLGNLVKTSISQKDPKYIAEGVSGPIGVYGAVKSVLDIGGDKVLSSLLELAALISLSLGIMNLLPIPALDGGRLVFIAYEWLTGKRVNEKVESNLIQYGFLFLIGLIVLITLKDIISLF